jgi:electron transport complex protein RnfE
MGRAEAFANKNNVVNSIADGIGMGLGFTLSLSVVATIREILGNGTWLNMRVMPKTYDPMLITLLAPGAFITLGFLMALMNMLKEKQ